MIIISFLNMRVLVPEEKLTETSPVEHLALQVWPAEIVQSNCILACRFRSISPTRRVFQFEREESTFLPCILYYYIALDENPVSSIRVNAPPIVVL